MSDDLPTSPEICSICRAEGRKEALEWACHHSAESGDEYIEHGLRALAGEKR